MFLDLGGVDTFLRSNPAILEPLPQEHYGARFLNPSAPRLWELVSDFNSRVPRAWEYSLVAIVPTVS